MTRTRLLCQKEIMARVTVTVTVTNMVAVVVTVAGRGM